MRTVDLIWKKREGGELTAAEIHFLIQGFVDGTIPDYQMSAWCMAVYFQGMTFEECTALTLEMAHSGAVVDLSAIPGIKVDKHSTGGVGDKTSLVLLPMVAAAGVPVAKMSGRGLGHTGGTLDKLESLPGVSTALNRDAFLAQVSRIGIALAGQTGNLVPADKKLYGLRDVTATVESIPLIASSIVSKKLAAGADAVVLDVKFGDGAFMSQYDKAVELARTMVEIGKRAGRRFIAVLSDMNQPLGNAIGNSLEVAEAIATLQNQGPADLTELCSILGGYMIWLGEKADGPEQGKELALEMLRSGKAFAKFREMVAAQGGAPESLDHPERLAAAPFIQEVVFPGEGWVERVDCRALGLTAMTLGAGRARLDDVIRPEVGLTLKVKVGDRLTPQSVLGEVHAASPDVAARAAREVLNAIHLASKPVAKQPLIAAVIS
ncbi:thymidine phosphorylase [Hydrogenispora ethanolica]|uniref:Pyrimidine-nucleoside phosphorylase n=1 Tax=Hydrogenispora ethanolica TaxID=1082276 RepID=A0A4R1RB60_HYDET|nr:thymidine phosphorylase [Hydrogenispora ethanolica]TCL63014.1 thymidine phosphorylase [Hydrogenispora ethanolica]